VIGEAGDVYHVGIIVPDIEKAMHEYSASMGLTWCSLQDRQLPVITDDGPGTVRSRWTYSHEGTTYVELVEENPDTIWRVADGLHHIGRWTADLRTELSQLVDAGLPVAMSGRSESSGKPAAFSYHRLPGGGYLELVDIRMKPAFERWMAGGDFA
jgi:Glyoxalase/Bleomycin resistance protein/Dioxygenase superfamily